jgi:C1A family cysteine protease
MTNINSKSGLIVDSADSSRDYSLEVAISKLEPQDVEAETKNIRLEKVVLQEDGGLKKTTEVKYLPNNYLVLPLNKNDKDLQSSEKVLRLPKQVDLKPWFSPVKNQGAKPTCTAHAGIALMEYFQNRLYGRLIGNEPNYQKILSWRFLYKVTRNLMGKKDIVGGRITETDGATIRDTLKAMSLFGIAKDGKNEKEYWENADEEIIEEPSAFLYAYAQNYQASKYFRLDFFANLSTVLAQIRIAIAAGFPAIFALDDAAILNKYIKNNGSTLEEEQNFHQGGHALVAVGYDDSKEFEGHKEKGGFLIRNSWDEGWGDKGYGWLPYDYVLKGNATDWWSLLDAEWVGFDKFGLELDEVKNKEFLLKSTIPGGSTTIPGGRT